MLNEKKMFKIRSFEKESISVIMNKIRRIGCEC